MIPRARARGGFFGLIAGMAAVALVDVTTDIAFLWLNVVGAVAVVAVGMLLSLLLPDRGEPNITATEAAGIDA